MAEHDGTHQHAPADAVPELYEQPEKEEK